ncbi:MAG: hypothetical protein LKE53_03130 [Oscillospiraceae bacterium]|jgi:hypothetical protein|nr:hypothetical protein [Oscillospiraceae bacterium]
MEMAQSSISTLSLLDADSGFKKALQSREFTESEGKLVIPVGTLANGETLTEDIACVSNLLVAGTTGSGKTSFVRSVILSLITCYSSDAVKFIIYDSKMVDYSFMNGDSHMLLPVINDSSKATGALRWTLAEARNRLQEFSNVGTDNKADIFMILDDYSELAVNSDCSFSLAELLKIGRKAKVHCLLITAVPSSKILTPDIKANIPCRVSFYTTSRSASRMILDANGAEELQYPGEMLFKLQSNVTKCMDIFLPDDEISKFTQAMRKTWVTDIKSLQQKAIDAFSGGEQIRGAEDKDDLFESAVEVVFETKQASTSMLQRRLNLGYSRAGRLVDMMEEAGIVGPFEGSKPRAILMTYQQYLLKKMGVKPSINDCAENGSGYPRPLPYIQPSSESSAAQQPSAVQQSSAARQSDEIQLHSQPELRSLGDTIDVKDNLIHICKKIGSTTSDYSFGGKRIERLIYCAPKFFIKGKIIFVVVPMNWTVNDMRDGRTYTSDMPRTEISVQFEKNNAPMFQRFINQISKDIGMQIEQK